jgi:MoxR-like ATPase
MEDAMADTHEQKDDVALVNECDAARQRLMAELRKVIVGMQDVIDDLLTALLANGHILLVGVPGLAKTLLISSVAQALNLKFKRVQFTPDLMPGDITGTEVIQENISTGERAFRFIEGPVFCNLLLADEINRTPPKTQAALLQAMQERQVSVGNRTYDMARPFMVLATQNPIELEGTYPLPEAQLDRFMFNTFVDYTSDEELGRIVDMTTAEQTARPEPVLSGQDILRYQQLVRRVPLAPHVRDYTLRLTVATRPKRQDAAQYIKDYVSWGCGPRAAQFLALGAKARTILHGQFNASVEDVRAVARSVLRHRIFTNFNAQADGVDVMDLIDRLLNDVRE